MITWASEDNSLFQNKNIERNTENIECAQILTQE